MQANKPQWPADDCHHGCCNGEKPPTSPAVAASTGSRKEGSTSAQKSQHAAAKSADKARPAALESCSLLQGFWRHKRTTRAPLSYVRLVVLKADERSSARLTAWTIYRWQR